MHIEILTLNLTLELYSLFDLIDLYVKPLALLSQGVGGLPEVGRVLDDRGVASPLVLEQQ